jgi:DNA-binding transcriptional LysR family regulator
MEIQILRWFREVADGATVTETAQRARITQPALSRALARLEEEVGTPLLTRAGRKLTPTPAGRLFKEHVDQVLDHYDLGLRAVAEFVDPAHGLVPLAFLHTLGTWLVPPLVSSFREAHPLVRFELHQHGEASILRELVEGAADLIITSPTFGHPRVTWRRLLVEPLRLTVPPRHRLAGRRRVRLLEAADEPFILLRSGYALRVLTERLCAEAGFSPKIAFEGEEVETLRALVAAGLGVALLPPPRATPSPSQSRSSSRSQSPSPLTSPSPLPAKSQSPSPSPSQDAADADPAPQLHVTDVDSTRELGLAWLTDRELPPASAAFRDHVLASAPAITPADYRIRRR